MRLTLLRRKYISGEFVALTKFTNYTNIKQLGERKEPRCYKDKESMLDFLIALKKNLENKNKIFNKITRLKEHKLTKIENMKNALAFKPCVGLVR